MKNRAFQEPLFKRLFLPYEIGQGEYALRYAGLILFSLLVVYPNVLKIENTIGTLFIACWIMWFVFCVFCNITLPRMRNIGMPVWLLLLNIIPVVGGLFGLALLCLPEDGWNKNKG